MDILAGLSNAFASAFTTIAVDMPLHGATDQRGWEVIVVTMLGSVVAQLIKIVTKLIKTGTLDLRVLAKTGGMPSSHSACTVGLATTVGLIDGFNSVTFAIALGLAAIVMYDAAGVRRTVGLQAQVLNQMITEIFSEHPHISSERIKEFLGHTPKEVIVGALLGIAIACSFNYWAYPWIVNR